MEKEEEEPNLEDLLIQLKDEDWKVRKQAVLAIGKIKTDKSTQILHLHFKKEKDRVVKKATLLEISRKRDYTSATIVFAAQSDIDPLIRNAAKEAIQRIRGK